MSSPGGLSVPGSPLDVGNFFSDLMHTASSRERSPAVLGDELGLGKQDGHMLIKGEDAGGGLGATACGGRLPKLKEEPESRAGMGYIGDGDEDDVVENEDAAGLPPADAVVIVPGEADSHDGKPQSVRTLRPSPCARVLRWCILPVGRNLSLGS
jgi:hypothetical protein